MFLDVCDAGLPAEGVVEVGLEAAGLVAVEEVLGVAGLAVLVVGGRVEPVAGRGDADAPVVGLKEKEEG